MRCLALLRACRSSIFISDAGVAPFISTFISIAVHTLQTDLSVSTFA
jgi:hypothetical protein